MGPAAGPARRGARARRAPRSRASWCQAPYRLPECLVRVEDARPREAARRRAAVGTHRAPEVGPAAERLVRGEELARVVALHDDGVAERDGVILAGTPEIGDAAA